jgi:hypothetical protein
MLRFRYRYRYRYDDEFNSLVSGYSTPVDAPDTIGRISRISRSSKTPRHVIVDKKPDQVPHTAPI